MFRAPYGVQMPSLLTMLDDLPHNVPMLCKHLDISRTTLDRYIKAEGAPRPVMLALFWETRWGVSQINCQAVNDAMQHAGYSSMLRQQNAKLKDAIKRLEAERTGNGLAANLPMFRIG